MKKFLILSILSLLSFANEELVNMKNCESIRLSNYTTLVSCHKIDYLIEYRFVDDEEKDPIRKITAITSKDTKVIKNIGK